MHVKYELVCQDMEYGEEQCKGLHVDVHAKISKASEVDMICHVPYCHDGRLYQMSLIEEE